MIHVVRDWRVELVEAYPDLFQPVGDAVRPGLARGRRRLPRSAFYATQIREKYGTLRFYWEGALSPEADAQVEEEAIDLAEARSACTCEICGEEGRLYGDEWRTTRWAAHSEGREPVEIRPHLQNVHIEEWLVGDRREVRCRR